MKMLKSLVIALVCVGFSVAVGCGPDEANENNGAGGGGGGGGPEMSAQGFLGQMNDLQATSV